MKSEIMFLSTDRIVLKMVQMLFIQSMCIIEDCTCGLADSEVFISLKQIEIHVLIL